MAKATKKQSEIQDNAPVVDPNVIATEEQEQEQEGQQLEEEVIDAEQYAFGHSFPEDLKATLEVSPWINCVWVNEKGEWHFAGKAGYTAIAREDILNG